MVERFLRRVRRAIAKHGWLFCCVIACGFGALPTAPQAFEFVAPGVAYNPRGFLPGAKDTAVTRQQIIDDLRLLRAAGFRSLVTYDARGVLGAIPELARRVGFDGTIVMGLWDIASEEEIANALQQAPFVSAYCAGNEGLGTRYEPATAEKTMARLRAETGLPVTTSEPIDRYLTGPYRGWLASESDWLFPLAHPYWSSQHTPGDAVAWITTHHDYLASETELPVVLRETGYPSSCETGCSEEDQLQVFRDLEEHEIAFYYFEAFDQPWKTTILDHQQVEAHWGLFTAEGRAKKVVSWIASRWSEP